MPKYKKGQQLRVDIYRNQAEGKSAIVPCIMRITEATDSRELRGVVIYPKNHKYTGTYWNIAPETIRGPEYVILCIKNKI